MASAARLWYFSTIVRLTRKSAVRPRAVAFDRSKYGRSLSVDADHVRDMPGFIADPKAHVLDFHELLLVTRGRGTCSLDGERIVVRPGVLLLSAPGQVRAWNLRDDRLDGACLCFSADFLTDAFADSAMLQEFACFRWARPSGCMVLRAGESRAFQQRFATMRREIGDIRSDSPHRLRAVVYELLVLVNRWYVQRHGSQEMAGRNSFVDRFRTAIDRDRGRLRRVSEYAMRLGCTPGHLNHLCREHAGCSAGSMIRQRVMLEARRLLLHSGLDANGIAMRLGFEDPAYFSRFVRREAGLTPTQLKSALRKA